MIKKLLLSTAFCILNLYSFAQIQVEGPDEKMNLVKLNLFSLTVKTLSLQYERPLNKRISAAVGFRYMPKSSLPMETTFTDLADDEDLTRQISGFKTGNIAITPEIRFYLGKKGEMRGFYIAPFVRYTSFSAELPYEFDIETEDPITGEFQSSTETINLSGNLNTITGGILLGTQWKLSKSLYLDWWIFGPQYGSSSGKIDGKKTLTLEEQDALREQLTDLDDLPLVKTTSSVNGNGAQVKFTGPWAGLRTGLTIGFNF